MKTLITLVVMLNLATSIFAQGEPFCGNFQVSQRGGINKVTISFDVSGGSGTYPTHVDFGDGSSFDSPIGDGSIGVDHDYAFIGGQLTTYVVEVSVNGANCSTEVHIDDRPGGNGPQTSDVNGGLTPAGREMVDCRLHNIGIGMVPEQAGSLYVNDPSNGIRPRLDGDWVVIGPFDQNQTGKIHTVYWDDGVLAYSFILVEKGWCEPISEMPSQEYLEDAGGPDGFARRQVADIIVSEPEVAESGSFTFTPRSGETWSHYAYAAGHTNVYGTDGVLWQCGPLPLLISGVTVFVPNCLVGPTSANIV